MTRSYSYCTVEKKSGGKGKGFGTCVDSVIAICHRPGMSSGGTKLFDGAPIYYYELGVSSRDAISAINELPITNIIKKVMDGGCIPARTYMSKLSSVQKKSYSEYWMEISSFAVFATAPMVLDALSVDNVHDQLD